MTLEYEWEAVLCDGTYMRQFDDEGNETLFGQVENRMNDLKSFTIATKTGEYYSVDLQTGIIDLNGKFIDDKMKNKQNLKLVYTRRNSVNISEDGKVLSKVTNFIVGLSDNDEEVVVFVCPASSEQSKKVEIQHDEMNFDVTNKV